MAGLFRSRLTSFILVSWAILGCGGDDGGTGTPSSTTAIAKASNSGDAQSGTVGQTLASPLQVVVTEGGAPSAGATVTWSTTGGGSLDPASGTTDASGIASSSWTLGTTSGSQSAQATLSGASGSPVTFTATAAPASATTLEVAGGNGQSAPIGTQLPSPVQAKVSDEFGNGVPGVAVGWSAENGTVSAPSVTSDASGISAVNVTAGTIVGPIEIVAAAEGLSGSPLSFTATATAAPPPPTTANVSVVNNSFTPANITISAGTTVVWTWPTGSQDHNVNPVGTEPARSGDPTDGPHTYQFTFNTPGTFTYYCQVHGSPTAGMRGTVTVQ
jgi:plastocyanin